MKTHHLLTTFRQSVIYCRNFSKVAENAKIHQQYLSTW